MRNYEIGLFHIDFHTHARAEKSAFIRGRLFPHSGRVKDGKVFDQYIWKPNKSDLCITS